jgi:hypothetical protein
MSKYSNAYPFTNCTAFGYKSLYKNTAGLYNTAIGTTALSNNLTGVFNTAIGSNAGVSIVGSNNNTLLGANSDNAGNYNFSTAVGYAAQITASNQVVLGTSAEIVQIPGRLVVTGNVIASAFVPSDRRLKTNIQPLLVSVLPKIMELEPCTFDWRSTQKSDAGFIAQDYYATMDPLLPAVEKVMTPDGHYTLDYSKMVTLLVKAVQELTKEVQEQKKEVQEQKKEVQEQKKEVQEQKKELQEQKKELQEQKKEVQEQKKELQEQKKEVQELKVGKLAS